MIALHLAAVLVVLILVVYLLLALFMPERFS